MPQQVRTTQRARMNAMTVSKEDEGVDEGARKQANKKGKKE